MGWQESIAGKDSREEAREKFHEWCEMKDNVHDEITFVGRQNDVGRFLIDTDDNYLVRDMVQHYDRGNNPIRVISVDGAGRGEVSVRVLLAELTTETK